MMGEGVEGKESWSSHGVEHGDSCPDRSRAAVRRVRGRIVVGVAVADFTAQGTRGHRRTGRRFDRRRRSRRRGSGRRQARGRGRERRLGRSEAEVAAKTPFANVPSAPASAYVIQSEGSAFADWMTIGPPY